MKEINEYGKIYNLGNKELSDLCNGEVFAQEKIDGSQFSFMWDDDRKLICKSKNAHIDIDDPGMFDRAVETVRKLSAYAAPANWVFRCEYLRSEKHNTIRYGRVPKGHLVLLDLELGRGSGSYVSGIETLKLWSDLFDIELVRELGRLHLPTMDMLIQKATEWSAGESQLGGKMEGVVFKSYINHDRHGHFVKGKFVRPEFREANGDKWSAEKKGRTSSAILETIVARYKTEARWNKAIQHLRDQGQLTDSMQDIPKLMKEVSKDIHDEEEAEIREALWAHFWPQISRGVTRGLPEFYRNHINQQLINDNGNCNNVA